MTVPTKLILCCLAIYLLPISTALGGEAAAKLRPVVSLVRHDPKKIVGDGGLLLREIYRQAFLIAARDGLGCRTRDAVLRETLSGDSMQLALEIHPNKEVTLSLQRIKNQNNSDTSAKAEATAEGRILLEKTFPLDGAIGGTDYRPSIRLAETLSREEFIVALQKSGFKQIKSPRKQAPPPKWLDSFIDSFEPIFLYLAVRKLHEIMWRDGETPQLTARLARTYANLGSATDYFFNASPKVFKARALLYAARAAHFAPDDLECQLTRAYVFAVIGMPSYALPILKKHPLDEVAAKKFPWVIEAGQLARHETDLLAKQTDSKRAQYFAFLSAEFGSADNQLIAIARQALSRLPDSYRILERLAHTGGLGDKHRGTVSGHSIFTRQLRAKLKYARILKDSLTPLLAAAPSFRQQPAEAQNRAAITKILVTAGAGDAKEFSWTILGRFAEETSFLFVMRRIFFMRYSWSVDITDTLKEFAPVYTDHPYGKVITFQRRAVKLSSKKERRQSLAGVMLLDVEDKMRSLVFPVNNHYPKFNLWGKIWRHGDPLLFDYSIRMHVWSKQRNKRLTIARELLSIDPYGANAPTHILQWSPETATQYLDEWKKRFANNLNFRYQLAGYYQERDPDEALKLYQALIRESPGTFSYVQALARVYKQNGEMEKWKDTLEAYLEQPDSGLTHANIRNQIAKDYMRRMEYQKAVPYAERAAQTWAAWAMMTASEANELAGNYERAELWVRRTSERYSGSRSDWYFWCQRTGRGNLAAASKFYRGHVLAVGAKSKVARRLWESRDFYLFAEDYKTTIDFVKQQVKLAPNSPYERMYLAFLYGLQKNEKARAVNLQAVVDGFGKKPSHQDRGFYETAKQALGWFSGQVAVDPKVIHTALAKQGITLGSKGHFFIAIFAYQAGKLNAARADLIATAQNGKRSHSLTVYAWKTLRAMKLDPAALLNEKKRAALAKEKKAEKAARAGEEVF